MIFLKLFLNSIRYIGEEDRVKSLIETLKDKIADQLSYTLSSTRVERVSPDQITVVVCETADEFTSGEDQSPRIVIEIDAEDFNDRSRRKDKIVNEVLNAAEVALDDVDFTVILYLGPVTSKASVNSNSKS